MPSADKMGSVEPQEHEPLVSKDSKRPMKTSLKMLRLFVQFLTWVAIGSFGEVTGPVIPELISQTHSNYERILQAISMRGAGHIIGGILGGLIIDRFFHHIDLISAVVAGLFTFFGVLAAYVTSIELMFIVLLAQGALETFMNMTGYRIIFAAFKDNSAAACNMIQFGYYLGGVLSPAIVEKFVDGRFSGIHFAMNGSVILDHPMKSLDKITEEYPASFVTAYWILTLIGILVVMACVTLYIYSRQTGINIADEVELTGQQSLRVQASPSSCSPTHPVIAALFLVMLFFHIGCMFAMTRVYSKVIFSYDRDGPGLTVANSSLMTSSFFISSLCGILVFLLPTSFIHVKYLLQFQATLLLAVCILMYCFYTHLTALWVLFLTMGFCSGPIIGSGFAMVNRYIELTSLAQLIPQIGAAAADITLMYMVGYSYDHFGPYSIWAHALGISAVVFIVSTGMQMLAYFHGDRYDDSK